MKILELVDILSCLDEEEVYIKSADNELCEIEFTQHEAEFDGWDTAYPSYIVLQPKEDN